MFNIKKLNSKHQSEDGVKEVVYHCLTLEEYETLDWDKRHENYTKYE